MAEREPLTFDFPLPRTHCGVALGNGLCGALVWGKETINVTVNRADWWDHRGGERLAEGNDYGRLVAAYDPDDGAPLQAAFRRDRRPAGSWRSSRLPVGRFELVLKADLRPARAVLEPWTGHLWVELSGGGLLRLAMHPAACLVVIQRVLTDDDMTYLAYLTRWQFSNRLDFNDLIFGEPSLVHPRFWLMSAPFAQALLADLSQAPGILILSGYYEPFLVILSVLCWYELARTLQFSPRAAGASAILQLAFLLLLSDYLHPGSPYFNQLSADKATAAFIMAPVFFQSLMRLLDQPTKRNSLISLLTGLSLTFMHPVILAYSVFIGGALVLFRLKRKALPQLLLPIGIFIIILSPQVALRFASAHLQTDIPFTPEDVPNQRGMENLIARWGDTQFYGFNPRILDMNVPYGENIPIPEPVARRGWLILPVVSALFAVTRVRHNAASQFILACFLLCLLAWIPFTGWIIGYFLSAWMLERALWLFPFGLSSIFALTIIRDFARTRRPIKNSAAANLLLAPNWSLLTITFLTLGLFFLYVRENNLPDFEKFTRKTQRYKDIALAGQAMDRQIMGQAYVMGSQNLNDLIPGITLKTNLITYRISDPANMLYFTQAERERRIADTAAIFSKSTPAEDKLSLLEKYNVRFLLLQRGDLLLFEDLTTRHPDRAKAIEVGGVILLEIND